MSRLSELPYMLVKRRIPHALAAHDAAELFICCNLMDHRALGVGETREDAVEAMRQEYLALNPSDEDESPDGGYSPSRFSCN